MGFQPIQFSSLLPENVAANMSGLWETAIKEGEKNTDKDVKSLKYNIEKTWVNKNIDHTPVSLELLGEAENLLIKISAPFFDDPAPEGGKPGEAFFKLWDYEVV